MYSIYDGFFYSCMVGFAENYFSAYALFLKANDFQIGILACLPPLLTACAQLITLGLSRHVVSRRKFVVLGALIQGLSLLPVMAAQQFTFLPIEFYIVSVGIYFLAGSLIGPAWNSWMGDLVKPSQRNLYFGSRNRIITFGAFASMLVAGALLRFFKASALEYEGFLLVFGLGLANRFLSCFFLSRKFDPPNLEVTRGHPSFVKFLRSILKNNQGRLILYMSLVNFSVYLGPAYFTPRLIKDLRADYLTYTLIVSGATMMRFLSFRFWGRMSNRFGTRRVLTMSGFLISFSTLPWIFTGNPVLLFLAQCYTGLVWAAYELSTFTFLLENTSAYERVHVASYLNISVGVFGLLGGLTGAVLTSGIVPLTNPYNFLFATTAVLRIAGHFTMGSRLKEAPAQAPPLIPAHEGDAVSLASPPAA